MFRRCVSTVFWLRNSVGGDLGVRPAIDDEPGELELPFGERLDPRAVGLARSRAAVDAVPELAQLVLCLLPVAIGAAGGERGRRRLQLLDGTLALPALRERAAGQKARDRGIEHRPGPLRGAGRRECAFGGRGRVAAGERNRRGGPLGPGDVRAEAGLRRDGGREAGRSLGLLDAPERDPAARQQLEVLRPPAPRYVRQLLSSGRRDEQLGGLLRVAALHTDDCEDDPGVHRDVAFVQVSRQLDALLSRRQRRLHLALVRRDERAVHEVPGE